MAAQARLLAPLASPKLLTDLRWNSQGNLEYKALADSPCHILVGLGQADQKTAEAGERRAVPPANGLRAVTVPLIAQGGGRVRRKGHDGTLLHEHRS